MTLSSTTVKDLFNGDGTTDDFNTTFVFWNSSELRAILVSSSGYETTWTEGSEYTVTGGLGSVGTVVVTSSNAPATNSQLLVKSDVLELQEVALPAGGAFPSTSVEQGLDKIVRMIQEQNEQLDRTIQLSDASTFSDINFPDPVSGSYIRWAASLNTFENTTLVASTATIAIPVSIADGGTSNTTAAAALAALGGVAQVTSTDNAVVRFSGSTGQVQDSNWLLGDTDVLTAPSTASLVMTDQNLSRAVLADTGELYLGVGASGATHTFVFGGGHAQSITVSEALTVTMPTDWPASGTAGSFTLELINGEAFAITWPASVKWAGGAEPTFTVSGTDFVTFFTRDGGTTIYAFLSGLAMS